MNKENVLRVADAIEQHSIPDLGFNMVGWIREADDDDDDRTGQSCGTVACIAGWAHMVAGGALDADTYTIRTTAREFLGLPHSLLFLGMSERTGRVASMADATPAQAVAVLRHLAETGEVDWSLPHSSIKDR